ncbi:MAG: hypothetical protein ETSY2_38405 [Candidatus Entotheonella gemina]|uniref:Insertion element IS402-like domain-containing protein n=1 Tax=Candidatus Entotheonella gemina TaxID=1429439 RepID=W4LS19_9BACT|nr:MAG: hypothetical protein ETSY2_38405 [Candidatus Entotheonella gemina]
MSNGICFKPFYHHEPGASVGSDVPQKVDLRQIINGILWLNKASCQWCLILPTCGNWNTIYDYVKRLVTPRHLDRLDGVAAPL